MVGLGGIYVLEALIKEGDALLRRGLEGVACRRCHRQKGQALNQSTHGVIAETDQQLLLHRSWNLMLKRIHLLVRIFGRKTIIPRQNDSEASRAASIPQPRSWIGVSS